MTATTTTTSGAADRAIENCPELNMSNYDEVGVERLSDWAIRANDEIDRLTTQLAALAAGQATAAQPGVVYAELSESFLEIPDVQDESGINAYYSREVVLECIDAALASHGQAPAGATLPECLTCSDHGAVGNSGFDYKTAADFLSGKTVSDEALRKFVAASRGAHDARAALHAKMLSLQGELASREAEIALLKRSLLDAEADAAAPQSSPTAQSADSVPAVSDLPPLPAPDLRDVGTKPQEIKEFLKGYATEYARTAIAARAPADSVQEDAALWHWLAEYLVGPRTDLDDELIASATVDELRKLVDADLATRKQGATQ